MKIVSLQAIEALGNLMCYYNSDLNYIAYFHNFKNGKITESEYLRNEKCCFKRFLNEYKVARNVKKNKVKEFMSFTKEWVLSENSSEVDKFAGILKEKGITQDGKVMTSLASKILFLNNPETIIPIDTLNKRAVGEKSNIYSEFKAKVNLFISENKKTIEEYLNSVNPLLSEVEVNFKSIEIEFDKYRITRFVDKLLWTKGKK
ncbi:MAG: hypothetical protein WC637_15765 [Victivallales bacterium]|jgi:hypothetical protein